MNHLFKVIIPVKGKSIRVQNKNALPFGGKNTLLEWKINQIKEIFPSNNIVISSDFLPFMEIARQNGCLVHERKDPIISEEHPDYTWSELIYNVFNETDAEHFIWVPVTSPLMSPVEYKMCIEQYIEKIIVEQKFDSLMAVQKQQEYFWNETSPINYIAGKGHVSSINLPVWYKVTNSCMIISKTLGLEYKYYLGDKPLKLEVSKLAGVDIDYMEDYEMAEALLPLYLKKNQALKKAI